MTTLILALVLRVTFGGPGDAAPADQRAARPPAEPAVQPEADGKGPSAPASDQPAIDIELRLFQIDGEVFDELRADANGPGEDDDLPNLDVPLPDRPHAPPVTLTEDGRFSIAHRIVRLGPDGLEIGRSMGRDGFEPVKPMCSPRLVVFSSEEASIHVGRTVPYFERDADGCLAVRETDELSEGVGVHVRPFLTEGGHIRVDGCRLKVASVVGRQPLEGVPFDVGRPLIHRQEISTAFVAEPGRFVAMVLPRMSPKAPLVVMFLKATRAEK